MYTGSGAGVGAKTLTMKFYLPQGAQLAGGSGTGLIIGLAIGNSSTAVCKVFGINVNNINWTYGWYLRGYDLGMSRIIGSDQGNSTDSWNRPSSSPVWLKCIDNGTTTTFHMSFDGVNYTQKFSLANSTWSADTTNGIPGNNNADLFGISLNVSNISYDTSRGPIVTQFDITRP
jgi:hypothetical protein